MNNNESTIFSNSKADLIITKLIGPASFVVLLYCVIAEALGFMYDTPDGNTIFPVKSVKILLPIFFTLNFIFYFLISKFANQIEFRENERKINIKPFLGKDKRSYSYGQIEKIVINWYTTYYFTDGYKIKYRDDQEYTRYLINGDFNLRWKMFGKIICRKSYQYYLSRTRQGMQI